VQVVDLAHRDVLDTHDAVICARCASTIGGLAPHDLVDEHGTVLAPAEVARDATRQRHGVRRQPQPRAAHPRLTAATRW
jgi:hypothetical protein